MCRILQENLQKNLKRNASYYVNLSSFVHILYSTFRLEIIGFRSLREHRQAICSNVVPSGPECPGTSRLAVYWSLLI